MWWVLDAFAVKCSAGQSAASFLVLHQPISNENKSLRNAPTCTSISYVRLSFVCQQLSIPSWHYQCVLTPILLWLDVQRLGVSLTRDMKEPRGHEGQAGSSVPLFPGGEEGLKLRTPSDTIVSHLNAGRGKNLWAVSININMLGLVTMKLSAKTPKSHVLRKCTEGFWATTSYVVIIVKTGSHCQQTFNF